MNEIPEQEFYPEEMGFTEAAELDPAQLGEQLQQQTESIEGLTAAFRQNLRRNSDLGAATLDLYQRALIHHSGTSEADIRARTKLIGPSLEQTLTARRDIPRNRLSAEIDTTRSGLLGEIGTRFALQEAGLESFFTTATKEQLQNIRPEDIEADTRQKNDMWVSIRRLPAMLRKFGVKTDAAKWSVEDTFMTQIKGLPIDPRGLTRVVRPIYTEADIRIAANELFNPSIWTNSATPDEIASRKEKFLTQMLGDARYGQRSGFLQALERQRREYSNVGGLLIALPSATEGERRQSMIVSTHGGLTRPFVTLGTKPSKLDELPFLSQRLVKDFAHFYYDQQQPAAKKIA